MTKREYIHDVASSEEKRIELYKEAKIELKKQTTYSICYALKRIILAKYKFYPSNEEILSLFPEFTMKNVKELSKRKFRQPKIQPAGLHSVAWWPTNEFDVRNKCLNTLILSLKVKTLKLK